MPPLDVTARNNFQLLDKLEQMEQLIHSLVLQLLPNAEALGEPWETAHRVCDRYRIPRTA